MCTPTNMYFECLATSHIVVCLIKALPACCTAQHAYFLWIKGILLQECLQKKKDWKRLLVLHLFSRFAKKKTRSGCWYCTFFPDFLLTLKKNFCRKGLATAADIAPFCQFFRTFKNFCKEKTSNGCWYSTFLPVFAHF